MELPKRVLPDSVMFGSRTFDVAGMLKTLQSPRLVERYSEAGDSPVPGGAWTILDVVNQACTTHNVSPVGLLAKLQGETSYLTAKNPPGKGHLAPMGFGCPDGGADPPAKWAGPYRNIMAAAEWWGTFREVWDVDKRILGGMKVNVSPSGEKVSLGTVHPRSAAEVAYLLYTPHVYSLHDFWAILDRYFPGVESADAIKVVTEARAHATTRDIVEVALAAGRAGEAGQESYTEAGVVFDLKERGMCQRFARQVVAAAIRRYDPRLDEWDESALPHSAASAKKAEQRLLGGATSRWCPVERVSTPVPGCLAYCGNNGPNGHVVVYLGRSEVAENTSSRVRGPGTVLSALEDIDGITSWWRLLPLPNGTPQAAPVGDLKVVLPEGGVVECAPEEVGGRVIVDLAPVVEALSLEASLVVDLGGVNGHLVPTEAHARVVLKDLVEPYGWAPKWVVHDDGRRRVYLKREAPR